MINNPLPQTQVVKLKDIQYLLFDIEDAVTTSIIHEGSFEKELLDLAKDVLSKKEPGRVLDIGANLGSFTIPLAKELPDYIFESYEPQRIIFYQLCGNVFLNSLNNIFTHNFGLSDKEEFIFTELPIYNQKNNIGAYSLDRDIRARHHDCTLSDYYEYTLLKKLDSLNYVDVRLIKIDVEGMEMSVIRGGLDFIKRNEYPTIIFETWVWKGWYQPKRQELYNFLIDLGYDIHQIGENNIAEYRKN